MSVVQFVVQDLWQSHMQFWSQFALPVCHFESLSARNPAVAGEFAAVHFRWVGRGEWGTRGGMCVLAHVRTARVVTRVDTVSDGCASSLGL